MKTGLTRFASVHCAVAPLKFKERHNSATVINSFI